MKEKHKTALIIVLLIISLILIIGCRSRNYTIILPGYSPKSISIIRHDRLMTKGCDKSIEDQLFIDSIFYDRYEFQLTR